MAESPPPPPTGIIHDIGYRPYAEQRLGEGAVAWALFTTGLRHCFGLGRSGKSKVLPMMLLAIMLLPPVIIVGVTVVLGLSSQPVDYSRYPLIMSLVISTFVAAQSPALISRDLRYRMITLYLARPLRRSTYVLARFASLTVAVLVLIALPLLVLYVGGLLADLPFRRETADVLAALLGALLLSATLAGVGAVIAAVTTRRGLAVAAIVTLLLVSYTAVSAVQAIAVEVGQRGLAEWAGLFSPYSLVDGVQVWALGADGSSSAPPTGLVGAVFAAVTLGLIAAAVGLLLLRYRRAAAA